MNFTVMKLSLFYCFCFVLCFVFVREAQLPVLKGYFWFSAQRPLLGSQGIRCDIIDLTQVSPAQHHVRQTSYQLSYLSSPKPLILKMLKKWPDVGLDYKENQRDNKNISTLCPQRYNIPEDMVVAKQIYRRKVARNIF